MFAHDDALCRWIRLARERVAFQGLPARIFWLGYGERARFGLALNDLVRRGIVKAPIVIGRDHLDTGSVASPNRETEGMRDGSDAIADWPVLNALLNTSSGATWVSVHHGGGVGIGYSLHAGMVVVADGTPRGGRETAARADLRSGPRRRPSCRRRLPGGIDAARRAGIDMPMAVHESNGTGGSADDDSGAAVARTPRARRRSMASGGGPRIPVAAWRLRHRSHVAAAAAARSDRPHDEPVPRRRTDRDDARALPEALREASPFPAHPSTAPARGDGGAARRL